jgi:hypothetical protein
MPAAVAFPFVVGQWVIVPVVMAGIATNTPRPAIPDRETLGLPAATE